MWAGARKARRGDLSIGSGGLTVNSLTTGTPFTITASQLGVTTIEEILEVRVANEVPQVANVSIVYQLSGTSTAIGGTVTSSAGTTAGLQAVVLGV